jgi:isopentenyl diphosphate isomerase/L-lactate dehydrogenase-like FMN-dependent dehydrogenase
MTNHDRRRFLHLLAASPLASLLDLPALIAQQSGTASPASDLITSVGDALNVFDFEAVARTKLPPWHWAWMSNGAEDGATIRANRDGFDHYQIRARRLVDVSKTDMSVTLFGKTWETPIFLCPVSGHRMYNPQAELATARAAQSKKHLQMLSTMTTTPVEEVNAARGEPVWFQLYTRPEWSQTRELVKRVEAAGCPALVFTVDLLGGRNTELFSRVQQRNQQQCASCHKGNPLTDLTNRPMVNALASTPGSKPEIGTPTWDYIKRLRDTAGMKLLVKGIVTREDAEIAVERGVDGVIVSNHGGRGEDSGRATIDSLPEVAAGVAGRVPILFDSGIRRGSDIFKALALGANAVAIGRPYIWGLASFGQQGVEKVLDILRSELLFAMRQAGTRSIAEIKGPFVVDNRRGYQG